MVYLKKQYKYNIYIGLLCSDMKTPLKSDEVIKKVSEEFLKIGISGFNTALINGFWEGKKEPCLKISFINSFNTKEDVLISRISFLKGYFLQESILIEKEAVQYGFI